MALLDSKSFAIVATVLNDVEKLLAGESVAVAIPTETIKVGSVEITTPAIDVQVRYNAAK